MCQTKRGGGNVLFTEILSSMLYVFSFRKSGHEHLVLSPFKHFVFSDEAGKEEIIIHG